MLPVQQALYVRLTTDSTLMDLITGVFDYLPEEAAYPFVVIGESVETADNSHGKFGRETVITLHVWTQYRGHTQGLQIGARVTELLDHQPLTIEALRHVFTHYEFGQTLTDPEPPGNIRHLVLRYRIATEQPS